MLHETVLEQIHQRISSKEYKNVLTQHQIEDIPLLISPVYSECFYQDGERAVFLDTRKEIQALVHAVHLVVTEEKINSVEETPLSY